jgi:hypothetical protein
VKFLFECHVRGLLRATAPQFRLNVSPR